MIKVYIVIRGSIERQGERVTGLSRLTTIVPQRVLIVTAAGASVRCFLVPHINALRDIGFEVGLACSSDSDAEYVSHNAGVRLFPVPVSQGIAPLLDVQAVVRLYQVMRAFAPTFVHAHMSKGGLVGMVSAFLAGVPVRIYQNHGLAVSHAVGFRRWLLMRAERTAHRFATDVVYCSNSTLREGVRLGLTSFRQARVLGHGSISGIDVDRFSPQRRVELSQAQKALWGVTGKVVVGFVGRIVPHKGIGTLLEAWAGLPIGIRTIAALVLVGRMEDKWLARQVKEAQVCDSSIHYVGWYDDIVSAYSGMDILTLPSWYEGLPYSVLEAQAMETPVVVTDVLGNVDAVVPDETGLVIPVADANLLTAALSAMILRTSDRTRMGRNGRKRIVRDFRQEIVLRNLADFYTDLWTTRFL